MSDLNYPVGYAGVNHGPHCGVLATAVAADITFQEARDRIKQRGRYGPNWKGRTYIHDWTRVFDDLGLAYCLTPHVDAGFYRHHRSRRPGLVESWLPRCTVATFAKKYAEPGVTYLLRVSGHVVTLRNGLVCDQNGIKPVSSTWTARRFVLTSIKMLRKDDTFTSDGAEFA